MPRYCWKDAVLIRGRRLLIFLLLNGVLIYLGWCLLEGSALSSKYGNLNRDEMSPIWSVVDKIQNRVDELGAQ